MSLSTDIAARPSRAAAPAREAPVRRLQVLAPTRYPWLFNGPRHSRHAITRRNFVPLNKISAKIEGVTAFNPIPPRRFDLVHAFNRIPLGRTPFVIGFESHLPRAFGMEKTLWFRALSRLLASPQCRGIVAISDYAADMFRRQHETSPSGAAIVAKLSRRHPNIELGLPPTPRIGNGPLRVSFVGNHFARKGGCVAVKAAALAAAAGLPVEVRIVSTLEVGGAIWTDPVDRDFFDPYLALLDRPNVTWTRNMANADVQRLLRDSDVSLLTTFGDTFGFSAIESMAQGTPVIGTAQGALPEFIVDGESGFLLPIPVDDKREWIHLGAKDRGSAGFKRLFADEVDALAHRTFDIMATLVDSPGRLASLRYRAYERAKALFCAEEANQFWDDYYNAALTKR